MSKDRGYGVGGREYKRMGKEKKRTAATDTINGGLPETTIKIFRPSVTFFSSHPMRDREKHNPLPKVPLLHRMTFNCAGSFGLVLVP